VKTKSKFRSAKGETLLDGKQRQLQLGKPNATQSMEQSMPDPFFMAQCDQGMLVYEALPFYQVRGSLTDCILASSDSRSS
jgi:hypothetical protein